MSWFDNFLGLFCQVSTAPNPLPQGLHDPPTYSPSPTPIVDPISLSIEEPPSYSCVEDRSIAIEKHRFSSRKSTEDVLHFLDPSRDSISSLSLQYGVPQNVLRRKNGLFADRLLVARQTILIPGEFYKDGISLSPQPIGGEEEEMRKAKVRRWMIACKVAQCVDHSMIQPYNSITAVE